MAAGKKAYWKRLRSTQVPFGLRAANFFRSSQNQKGARACTSGRPLNRDCVSSAESEVRLIGRRTADKLLLERQPASSCLTSKLRQQNSCFTPRALAVRSGPGRKTPAAAPEP